MIRLIDYLESAIADNTGTSQMDRLLAEDEISKSLEQPQYTIGTPDYGKNILEFETAAQDETAHTNIDALMAEYGQSQQPQYSMREYQEPYDPARAIAEGSFMPIMGAIGVGKELTDKMALSAREKVLPPIKEMIRQANRQWTKSKGPENRKVRNLAEKEASELGQLIDMMYDR